MTDQALTKHAILAAQDLRRDFVTIKEWGGVLHLSELSGLDLGSFEDAVAGLSTPMTKQDRIIQMSEFLVRAIVDEDGQRIFDDTDASDLAKKGFPALLQAFDVATDLSGVSGAAEKETAKN